MKKAYSISLPNSQKNVDTVRRFAKSKELKLAKVRNHDLWDVKVIENNSTLKSHVSLDEAYNFIKEYDY